MTQAPDFRRKGKSPRSSGRAGWSDQQVSKGGRASCWRVGVAAQCRDLQKASENDGYCDGYHHDTKGLGKTSRHTATLVQILGTFAITVWTALSDRLGHPCVCLLARRDRLKCDGLLQSWRRLQGKMGYLEHLNRDRVAPVLNGLPAVWFWLRSWFPLRLILLCHALDKACGETGSPSHSGGLPQGHLRPPHRSPACYTSQ